MTVTLKKPLTDAELVDALYHVPEHGKAEIINGKVVRMSPTGARPGRTAGKIYASLARHEEEFSGGYAFTDNIGFLVNLPDRKSFSPDAAWYTGPFDVNAMKFVEGAPALAVEVRSEGDYGKRAERAISRKIADYFAAGTLVVWDVDVQSLEPNAVVIRAYYASNTAQAVLFARGETTHAEPAVPDWRLDVDSLFTLPAPPPA